MDLNNTDTNNKSFRRIFDGHCSQTLHWCCIFVTLYQHLCWWTCSGFYFGKIYVRSLIDPSDMLHLIFGTSFLHHL